jgi:hypothetical protein
MNFTQRILAYCENNMKHVTTPCLQGAETLWGESISQSKKGKWASRRYGGGGVRFHSFLIPAIDGKNGQFCSQAALSLESSSTFLDHEDEWTPEQE